MGNENFISFSVLGEYNSTIQDGMSWGITNKATGEFYPILYIKNFSLGPENSEIGWGELVLQSCDLSLDTNASIIVGDLKISTSVLGDLTFLNKETDEVLLTIGASNTLRDYPIIEFLNNIKFARNQLGSNTLQLGENGCILTDEGRITANEIGTTDGEMFCQTLKCFGNIYCNNGVQPFSVVEAKKNIKKYDSKALDEIKNTDIYYYNYKDDKDNSKARIGAIIGKGYNCSEEIIGSEKKGIDLYSMCSIAYKAIQEQQEIIEDLKNEIKELKESGK